MMKSLEREVVLMMHESWPIRVKHPTRCWLHEKMGVLVLVSFDGASRNCWGRYAWYVSDSFQTGTQIREDEHLQVPNFRVLTTAVGSLGSFWWIREWQMQRVTWISICCTLGRSLVQTISLQTYPSRYHWKHLKIFWFDQVKWPSNESIKRCRELQDQQVVAVQWQIPRSVLSNEALRWCPITKFAVKYSAAIYFQWGGYVIE